MTIPTTERLALALEEAGAPAHLIEDARKGTYDDFKSPLAMPITTLVDVCHRFGLDAIAVRAKAGEFDSTREEANDWMRKQGSL
jgi:hypothetical protein